MAPRARSTAAAPRARKASALVGNLVQAHEIPSTRRRQPAPLPTSNQPLDPTGRGQVVTDAEREASRLADLHKKALQRYRQYAEAWREQEQAELEETIFEALDMWDPAVRADRSGDPTPGVATPSSPRPVLEVNKIEQPIQQNVNQMRQAKLGIQIIPAGDGANAKSARVRQGLVRDIEVKSVAGSVYRWQFERTVKVGRGFSRLIKVHVDGTTGVEAFDQELRLVRILNQGSVLPDPFCINADFSDMTGCFIDEDLPEDIYEERYGHLEMSKQGLGDELFRAINPEDRGGNWFYEQHGLRRYRVSEFFYTTETRKKLVVVEVRDPAAPGADPANPKTWPLKNRQVGWEADLTKPLPAHVTITHRKTITERKVHWLRMNGVHVLETAEWEGSWIPVLVSIGKEYNIAGKRRFKGMIANAMGAQRTYNYMTSALVESVAFASRQNWVLAEGQAEGYEHIWKTANTKAWAYLTYKPKTIGGQLAPAPHREGTPDPNVQAITVALGHADADIKSSTGWGDPSLGMMDGHNRSGKAVNALKASSDLGTSNYLDDFANVTLVHAGRMINEMLPYVYDRPGRVQQILTGEDEPEEVMLNQPHVRHKGTFIPMTKQQVGGKDVYVHAPSFNPAQPQAVADEDVTHYDLSSGRYSVAVTVGKATTVQQEQDNLQLSALAQAAPGLVPLIADLWVRSMNLRHGDQIADRIKSQLPPALRQGDQDAQTDPKIQLQQVKQAADQMQQTIQMLSKELMQKTRLLEDKQLEYTSKERIALLEARYKLAGEAMAAQAKIATAQVKAEGDQAGAKIDAETSNMSAVLDSMLEKDLATMRQDHEARQAHMDRVFELTKQAREHGANAAQADTTHQNTLEQQQQQADLQPAPEPAQPAGEE